MYMFLDAGLARIDNIFMKSRRLFSARERPVGTSRRRADSVPRIPATLPRESP